MGACGRYTPKTAGFAKRAETWHKDDTMRRSKVGFVLLSCLLAIGCASEPPAPSPDDPLTGTWTGDWGTEQRRDRVELQLDWTSGELEGAVNPRSEDLEIENAAYDAATGRLSFEFDAYDDGNAVRYVIEGKVDGTTLAGTWRRDGQRGDFQVERNAR
jgi:hypothetical protein